MTTKKVSTKNELKEAIKNDVDVIIVSKELENDIDALIKLMRMPAKKRNAMITFLGAGGAVIVASLAAAPATMGISSVVAMPAVITFAATSGVSIPIVAAILILGVAIGIPTIISLIRMYEIVDDDFSFEIGKDGFKFKRKSSYATN